MTKDSFKLQTDTSAAAAKKRESVANEDTYEVVLEGMSTGDKGADPESGVTDEKTKSEIKEAQNQKTKVVGFFELYRFATGWEIFWCIIAFCCALIAGTQVTLWAYLGSTAITDYYNINQTFNESNDMAEQHYQDQVKDIAIGLFKGYFVTMFIVLITSGINMGVFVAVADRVTKRIREAAFRNILRQHMGYFDTHNTGELIGILAEDVNKVQSGMAEKMATTAQWLGQFLSSVIVSFLGSWVLSLLAYCLLPFAIASGMLAATATQKLSKLQILAYGDAGTVAEESLSAIRMVVAFGGEIKQGLRYLTNLSAARKVGTKIGLASAGGQSFTHFITLMVIAVTFGIGGLAFINGNIDEPGVIFQVMLCSAMSMRTLSWMTMNSEFISQSRAAAYGIYKLIDAKSEIDPSDPEGLKPNTCQGTVEFDNIVFEYPNRRGAHVLNGLSLKIPAGKNIALVGPSGCGKSTTIQLLQRYYDPLEGRVLLDGHNVKDLNVQWLRGQIGVVSQEPVLFATSIEENIRFGRPDATQAEVVACAKDADAHDFIMSLPNQYETVINEMGTLLSRGEKQRISLARALIRNPTILLLDECTSALDNESELVVQTALEKASKGRTTITIAHRLSTVRNCDILFCVNEGINWEHGSHDELVAQGGLYSRLVANQMKGQAAERAANKVEEAESRSRSSSVSSIKSIYEELDEKIRLAQEDVKLEKAPLSRIFKLNSPEWPYLLTGVIGAIFMGCGFPLAAIILGTLIEIFGMTNEDDQMQQLNTSVPALCIIAVLSALGGFAAVAALKYAGEWLTLRVRSMAFNSMLRQEIGWFDRKENQTGALTSRLANQASRVQQATGTVIVAVFAGLTTIIGAVIIALAFGWQLGLPCLLYVPVIISVSLAQAMVTTKFAAWAQEATMEGGKIVAETIDKIRVVASLTKEDFFTDNFNRFFEALAVKNVKKAKIVGCTWGLTYFLMGGTFVLTFPLGMYWVGMGVIGFESIFIIFYGIAMATYEFARINAYMTEFSGARAAAAELFKVIDRESEINIDKEEGKKPKNSAGELMLEDVSFKYPTRKEVRVLRRFNLQCSRGQFIAMVGPSGSGKSTAIQLFERFYDVSSGIVQLDNVDVRDLNLKWLREQMGIVTQDPILFNISLRENISFGDNTREVPMDDIIQAAKCANIHNFIASLPKGYDTDAGSKGTQLSGGQKQRVSIARALVRNPKLLLLDDATSALDSESEKVVEEALENAREGRTSIVVSHRLSSIIHADMIYYVDGGKVLEKGTHTELMGLRSHYYNLQQANMGLG